MKRRQRFLTWCKKDLNDDRKINYTCNIDGEIIKFTSEDEIPADKGGAATMAWLRGAAKIDKIELINDEWFIELSE